MSKDYTKHFNDKASTLLLQEKKGSIQALGRKLDFRQRPEWCYFDPKCQYSFETCIIQEDIIYLKEQGSAQAKDWDKAQQAFREVISSFSTTNAFYLVYETPQCNSYHAIRKKLMQVEKYFFPHCRHIYLLFPPLGSHSKTTLISSGHDFTLASSLEDALANCIKQEFPQQKTFFTQEPDHASPQDLMHMIRGLQEENQRLKLHIRKDLLKHEKSSPNFGLATDNPPASEETILNKLRESQEQLRSTFSSIDDHVYVFDKYHKLIASNVKPDKIDFLATHYAQCHGKAFYDIFPADLSGKLETALNCVAETHEVQQFEHCLSDHLISLYFKVSVNYRKDSAGRYAGFTMVARDITEEKIADKKIIESEKKYRSVVESVREVIFQTDIRGKWSFLNPAWKEISGHDIFSSLERPVTDFIHKDDRLCISQLFDDILQQRKDEAKCEVRFVNSQHEVFWADVFMKIYLNESGRIAGISGTLDDITKRKKAEVTLRRSNQLLESINKNIKEALIRVNHKDGFMYFNQAFIEMFGYHTSAEIKKLPLQALFAQQHDLKTCTNILRKQQAFTNKTIKFRRKDGSTFWGLSSFMLIVDEHGQEFYDGAIRDITDRKEAEKKLKEKNQELIKTNEELDRFVYSASHDLRAPLASTLGLINISRISSDKKERAYYLDLMEQSLNRMDKIIQDLTDYSRNARLEIETEEIDFKSMIKDVLQRLKYLKNIDEVKINTKIVANDSFYSDKIRLYIILLNLISNSIKYHKYDQPNPFIHINITIDAKKAVIAVMDNGIGIDKSHVDKIFTMFFQVSRDSIGSGLGLYIAKETINKLLGSITVESRVSKGSTFTVTLPNAKTHHYEAEG